MNMKTLIDIQGMTCASCVAHIEGDLKQVKGVSEAQVNLVLNQGEVTHDHTVTPEKIIKTVEGAGYGARLSTGNDRSSLKVVEHSNHLEHAVAASSGRSNDE